MDTLRIRAELANSIDAYTYPRPDDGKGARGMTIRGRELILDSLIATITRLKNEAAEEIKRDVMISEERMIVQGVAIEKADFPIREGHVRVVDAYFCVALEKITNHSTKVTYQSKTNASFNAPAYLSKTICGNMVYNSMVNLKTLLNDGR
jgi:hypothetical protein